MKNNNLGRLVLSLITLVLVVSCTNSTSIKLDPNGVYLGDTTLYQADAIVAGSADAFTAFVKWEHLNRDQLASVPEVRKLSDQINLNSKQWIGSYFAVRDAYVAAPTDAGKVSLTGALQIIQSALAQAAIYLATPVPVTPAK
jgi:hypothetical protein